MIDVTTKEPLYVSDGGTAGPYIMVPLSQLDDLKRLLDANQVSYWVDNNAISLDGEPYIAFVNFGRDVDAGAVQAMLDGVNE